MKKSPQFGLVPLATALVCTFAGIWGCGDEPPLTRKPRTGLEAESKPTPDNFNKDNSNVVPLASPSPSPKAKGDEVVVPKGNKPPVIEAISAKTVRAGEKLSFSVFVKDPDNDEIVALTFKTESGVLPDVALSPSSPIASVLVDANVAAGTTQAIITATDKYNQVSQEVKFTLTIQAATGTSTNQCLDPSDALKSVACLLIKPSSGTQTTTPASAAQ